MDQKIIQLLDKAEYLAGQRSGGYSGEFLSAEEFHRALTDSIHKFKSGDRSQLQQLNTWFLPTSCWDDFVGEKGQQLANQISELLSKMINDEARK